MLKNCRLIALVFVFAASGFGAFGQNNETKTYKDVLLDGKPAKLNLVTGEITFTNGEVATSRTAKKIKDSVLVNRTEIKTNLLKDMMVSSETSQNEIKADSLNIAVDKVENSKIVANNKLPEKTSKPIESHTDTTTSKLSTSTSLVSNQPVHTSEGDLIKSNPYDYHMVKKGETLYQLSKKYNTSLGQLKIANNLETTLIKEGDTLRVRNFEAMETESDGFWIVSRGDTLYNIAKRNNTTVDDLKDINALSSNLIKIGQKLQVNQNSTLSKK